MTELERKILHYISERSIPGQMRPTTTEIHREFGFPAAKHALGMLQILGFLTPIVPRKRKAGKRFRITESGRQALGREMAA